MKRVDASADSGDSKPAAKRTRQEPQADAQQTGGISSTTRSQREDEPRWQDEGGPPPPIGTATAPPMSVGRQRDSAVAAAAAAASASQHVLPSLTASQSINNASRLGVQQWASTALPQDFQQSSIAASATTEGHTSGPLLRDNVLSHLTQLQYDLMGQGRVQPPLTGSFPPALPPPVWMGGASIDALSLAVARGLVNPVDLLGYGRNLTSAPLQPQPIPTSAELLNLQQALLLNRAMGQHRPAVFDTTGLAAPTQHSLPPAHSAAAAASVAGAESIGEILASNGGVKGRVVPVSLPSDRETLSEYQCLLRQQIVFFEATVDDIEATAQGRNKPIKLGQVGILCKHCARLAPGYRPRGAVYFPARLNGIYQAAQNQATNHFSESCRTIPEPLRARAMMLKEQKTVVLGGGKQYWARAAEMSGVVETENGGLAFTPLDPANAPSSSETATPSAT